MITSAAEAELDLAGVCYSEPIEGETVHKTGNKYREKKRNGRVKKTTRLPM